MLISIYINREAMNRAFVYIRAPKYVIDVLGRVAFSFVPRGRIRNVEWNNFFDIRIAVGRKFAV